MILGKLRSSWRESVSTQFDSPVINMADDSVPRATRCGLAGRNVPADKPSEPMDTKVLEALVESDSEHGLPLGLDK